MTSIIADALKLATNPVALIWSDHKPEAATMFVPGKTGCVMSLFANVAGKGRAAVR